jgi:ATP-dependent DNA helicase Rep
VRFARAIMLNPQQREAVDYCDGPLLVLAGAGSGKTRVIVEKIAHLVQRRGLAAERIAAITFTNKAAREMRERLAKRLPQAESEALRVSTFHALGLRFLQQEHARAGLRRSFSVLDADDTAALLKDLLPKAARNDDIHVLRGAISQAKNAGLDSAAVATAARSAREHEIAARYDAYQQRLRAYNAVDFDDLIRLPLALLEADAELALVWRERLRYLLVDEYQDTNEAQYRLLKALAGPRGAFICVGDDDQSIYAWRGARPENLRDIARDYPTLRVLKLEQNYRCSTRILRCANALIEHNPHAHPKKLWSAASAGAPVRVLRCRDAEHEAARIATLLDQAHGTDAGSWGEYAVLYRGNHQSRELEKALRLARVPYHLSGALSFLDRAEVKDVLAYLRLLVNADDDAAFLRVVNVPRRDLGASSLEKLGLAAQMQHLSLLAAARDARCTAALARRQAQALQAFAALIARLAHLAEKLPASELLDAVLEHSGYRASLAALPGDPATRARREANLRELGEWFRAMQRGGARAGDLAQQLMLLGNAEREEPGNAVRLMTLHAAKGLEFDGVCIVGCDDATLPHEGALDEGRLEEERRLFYVGITRARRWLALSHSERVRRYGEIVALRPSRFIDELPAADLQRDGDDPAAEAETRRDTALTHLARLKALLES